MRNKARYLAFLSLGLAFVLLAYFMARSFVLRPIRQIDSVTAQLKIKLQQANQERLQFQKSQAALRAAAARLFGPTAEEAAAAMSAAVDRAIRAAGLPESRFSRAPVGPRHLKGALELGWNIQGEGQLRRLIDLLFLLDRDPRLHRVENLVLTASPDPSRFRFRAQYLSLVPNPPTPPPSNTNQVALAKLDGPERLLYEGILRRNLFMPFTPPRPEFAGRPPEASESPNQGEPSPEPDLLNPADLEVVSLSCWGGEPEAHIHDARRNLTTPYHPGDRLLSSAIVAIDFRPLPRPDKPGLLSYSRLILKQGDKYYAVELGQTLAERRELNPNELPKELLP